VNSLIPPTLSFFGGFFTALFAEPLRRWIYAPRLKLTFGTSADFFTRTPELTASQQASESLFVRLRVENVAVHWQRVVELTL
jgi:hypothetical protein